MYIKLTLLQERDSDIQIVEFENIGLIGYLIDKLDNFTNKYKSKHLHFELLSPNLYYIFLSIGYNDIPNKEILKYYRFPIKEIYKYTKNVANEMYFTKFIIKL